MALEAGSKLGHYEILSSLGAGGMGEVYRAKDTNLGREVAIKLLLEEVSSDPERLNRFGREAHLLASLNHPNIAMTERKGVPWTEPALVDSCSSESSSCSSPYRVLASRGPSPQTPWAPRLRL